MATLDDSRISIGNIFAGALPFVLCMIAGLIVLIAFPALSTYLARAA